MNAIPFPYTDFSSAALIKIFQLADILKVTPTRASEIYLAERGRRKDDGENGADEMKEAS